MKEAALVIIKNADNHILAVSRGDDINDWNLPCGNIEIGESSMETAIRELKEETNIGVLSKDMIYSHSSHEEIDNYIVHIFYSPNYSGVVKGSDEGIARFVPFEDIEKGTYGKFNSKLKTIFDGINI